MKKLTILIAMLMASSAWADDKYSRLIDSLAEGQNLFLECTSSSEHINMWFSFDTSKLGVSTGYWWTAIEPMIRLELSDVQISPDDIFFNRSSTDEKGKGRISRYKHTLHFTFSSADCYSQTVEDNWNSRNYYIWNRNKDKKLKKAKRF